MDKNKNTDTKIKSPVRRLLAYTVKHKKKLFMAVFFMLLSSGLNVLPPYLFIHLRNSRNRYSDWSR